MNDEQYLAQQRAASNFGVVTHERGLEVVDTSGWIVLGADFVCIYPDNADLIFRQPRVLIPFHRVVSLSVEGRD